MTNKPQCTWKETASNAFHLEMSLPPAAASTESETPDIRALLEQVLTK